MLSALSAREGEWGGVVPDRPSEMLVEGWRSGTLGLSLQLIRVRAGQTKGRCSPAKAPLSVYSWHMYPMLGPGSSSLADVCSAALCDKSPPPRGHHGSASKVCMNQPPAASAQPNDGLSRLPLSHHPSSIVKTSPKPCSSLRLAPALHSPASRSVTL